MRKLLLIAILCSVAVVQAQKIAYTLSMPNPYTHYFEVEMLLSELETSTIEVKMPTWAPGSYLIREFAKSVENFQVTNGSFENINKNTWKITTNEAKEIKITYLVYANEMSVRTSFINISHAYLNGTSVFMYLKGKKETPVTLTINPYKDWKKISTSLPIIETDKSLGGFHFKAPNYDILVDSPIEIGNHKEFSFEAAGVTHFVAMYGEGNYEETQLKTDMAKIVEVCTEVVGENPNKSYTFIIHNLTKGSGGLEHLSSTTLQVNRWTYTEGYKYEGFLSLVAHEYFHLWNVKRIRPIALGPFDYENENYTHLLWLCEGFTSYYDELLLKRAGYYSTSKYLGKLSGTISRIENQPGNKVMPVTEASFHAWTRAYRPNENSYNTTISYYPKGALLANALDLEILNNTNGKKNLDAVLKLLYQEYYKKQNRGFTDEEFQKAVEKVAGKKLEDFFKNNVSGTKTIEYNKFLGYAGCKLEDNNTGEGKPKLGVSTKLEKGKTIISKVIRGSSAYESGLNANDELIAINGYRVGENSIAQILANAKVDDSIKVTISRDGLLKEINVQLKGDSTLNYDIVRVEKPTKKQELVYKKWLSIK